MGLPLAYASQEINARKRAHTQAHAPCSHQHILSRHTTTHLNTSHHITPRNITPHLTTQHHTTYNTSDDIASHQTSYHITSHHITSHHTTPHHTSSHHPTSHTPHHITPRITSQVTQQNITSQDTSYDITSRITSPLQPSKTYMVQGVMVQGIIARGGKPGNKKCKPRKTRNKTSSPQVLFLAPPVWAGPVPFSVPLRPVRELLAFFSPLFALLCFLFCSPFSAPVSLFCFSSFQPLSLNPPLHSPLSARRRARARARRPACLPAPAPAAPAIAAWDRSDVGQGVGRRSTIDRFDDGSISSSSLRFWDLLLRIGPLVLPLCLPLLELCCRLGFVVEAWAGPLVHASRVCVCVCVCLLFGFGGGRAGGAPPLFTCV